MCLRITSVLIAFLLMLCAFIGCGSPTPTETDNESLLELADEVGVNRMMEVIEYLSSPELGGRPTGSPQSAQVEDYLENKLRDIGLDAVGQMGMQGYRQEFQVPPERCFLENPPAPDQPVIAANILGEIPGQASDEMIIITANYDGLGKDVETGDIYPGADYNASGVSSALEIATILSAQDKTPEKTLVFALLGAEECGGYGSQALAEALETRDLKNSVHIINLEGLGAGDGDYMDLWDLKYRKNRPVVKAVDEAASMLDVVLELGGSDPGTSASVFFLYHIPAVTCDWSWFERDEHPDFHLPSDLPERINRTGLLEVTRVVVVATWILGG
ncbi:MAG: M20/M25/M40 family metallo-hydrolase [Actinomycetota bacterium]|nr:M20/M25/M40 family metallo-hydrolase [Actinomycetota bacterium]